VGTLDPNSPEIKDLTTSIKQYGVLLPLLGVTHQTVQRTQKSAIRRLRTILAEQK